MRAIRAALSVSASAGAGAARTAELAQAATSIASCNSLAASLASTAKPFISLKRRHQGGGPRGRYGGGGGPRGAFAGGDRRRDDNIGGEESSDGIDSDDPRDATDPTVVAERQEKVRRATWFGYDERVPVDFAALEDDEYELAMAAAAQPPNSAVARSANPAAEWQAGQGRSGSGGKKGVRGKGKDAADGDDAGLGAATDVLFENPDAIHRIGVPSPQDRVSSLTSDPYGWPLVNRMPKEAPLWMLYEAAREEVPLQEGSANAGKRKAESRVEIRPPMRDEQGRAYATGRRKTASARVWVKAGDGAFTVNGKTLAAYFARTSDRRHALEPLLATQACGAFDVWLTVSGGGLSGQAGAIRHGLAGALARYDPYLKPGLKRLGLLLRDPRMVERKKPGQMKARRKFQWVKR